jgi:hypothetical protein
MVIHKNKTFERIDTMPNINYTNDLEAVVIDETTAEGKQMALNVSTWFPYYNYETDGKGNVISVTKIEKPEFLDATEVDAAVVQKIRQKYSQDDEFKMLNKGIENSQDENYLQYLMSRSVRIGEQKRKKN